jgi:hypothetical protein
LGTAEANEKGKSEGKGLAGSSRGSPAYITTGESVTNNGCLDRKGLVDASASEHVHQRGGKA